MNLIFSDFRKHLLCSCIVLLCLLGAAVAQEENPSYPLGPIGGTFRVWTGANWIRVESLTPSAPGAVAGLQVNDFIYGAYGRQFSNLGDNFEGVVRQLGAAIDHAESSDGQLPLLLLRPGVGSLTVTVDLPVTGALSPAHPLTSPKFAAAYESACAEIHASVMGTGGTISNYPKGFAGLCLLGHPDWNSTSGAKPYRNSINELRDYFVGLLDAAIYAPTEDLLLDHEINGTGVPSENPNYEQPPSLENWGLGAGLMFLSEYYAKTGDTNVLVSLQRATELMANRVQWWKQPPLNANGYSPGWESRRGMTSHLGVTGDYIHLGWGGGINMTGVHMFSGLALAKRAGVNMDVRPRDGHYFGYDLHEGDAIPAEIASALPSSIDLPHGAEDPVRGSTITDPFWYDMSLDQKFWLKWDFLIRASGSDGHVNYAVGTGGTGDAGGRTPGALFGFLSYMGTETLDPVDQALVDKQKEYITLHHDRHLNAHAYNAGGSYFTALCLPYLDDRSQRYFLNNWRFYHNLMRQPDGSNAFFQGRNYNEVGMTLDISAQINIALARSVAIGGLQHVPGYDTNRIFVRFNSPFVEWPSLDARSLELDSDTYTFDLDLTDIQGGVLDSNNCVVTWSVISGPATTGIIGNPSQLETTVTFPQPGIYRLQVQASHGGLITTELIDVKVPGAPLPSGWTEGIVNYEVYTGLSGRYISDLTGAAKFPDSPDISRTLTRIKGDYTQNNAGCRISGYIVAPTTGSFQFYIASDYSSELRLNTTPSTGDEVMDQVGLSLIASVSGWCSADQWDKYSSQQSAPVSLTAGQLYRFEVLQVQGSGGNHVSVGWTQPGQTEVAVIGADDIAVPPVPGYVPMGPAIVGQPVDQLVSLGDSATFALSTTGPEPSIYQWRRNGVPLGNPGTASTLEFDNVGAGHVGVYDCVFTSGDQVIVSDPARLSISDADFGTIVSGGLWQEVYNDIDGNTVDTLTNDDSFPRYSDASGVITSAETETMGDKYGQRWTGWLVPTETASYRFYLTSDDASELWVSSDDSEANKQLITSLSFYKTARKWSSVSPSSWISLVAGQRYYIEVLHKEGSGGDHAEVAWQKSGDPVPANDSDPIGGEFFEYRVGGIFPDELVQAVDDQLAAEQDTPLTADVVANDTDDAPAYLLVDSVTQPAHGSVTFSGREVTYTPVFGYTGGDTFSYVVLNANGFLSTGNVTVTVEATPLGQWKNIKFTPAQMADLAISGDDASPDGDQIPNLLEYALVLDPKAAEPLPLGGFTDVNGVSTWLVEFQRHADRTDIDLILERSTDMNANGWVPIARSLGGGAVEVLNGGVIAEVSGSDPETVGVYVPNDGQSWFIRWRAMKQ